MRARHFSAFILPVALLAGVTGCATPQTLLEATFGDSARQLVDQQVADPGAADRPVAETTMDGIYAENVLDAYRTDVAKPAEVSNDIVLNIGK